MLRSTLTATFLLLTAASITAEENWPGWRGPTGMGQTDEKDLPLKWGGKDGTNVLWKKPLFPAGKVQRDQNQSSPVVWGDKIFVTVSYWPEGISQKEYPEHHVLCFAAADGKKLWDTPIEPGPWKLADLRGGYTAPTPCCDGERIYVVFGSSVIAAVDFSGKVAWRKEIKPHQFDVCIGASPLVHKGTVLFVADQLAGSKASSILAYDTKSGELKWKKERPTADWAHCTPLLTKVGDKQQLILGTAHGPEGVDPDTGESLWSVTAKERIGDTVTPLLHEGLVYVDSGRGGPGVAADPTGKGDVTKTHLKWRVAVVPEGFSSPVAFGPHLFRLSNPATITCRKWADGEEVFRERLQGLDAAVSPLVTPEGRIYCATAGKSYVLQAGDKLKVLAENDLGDPSRASPAVAKGKIYLKGGEYLFCVGNK